MKKAKANKPVQIRRRDIHVFLDEPMWNLLEEFCRNDSRSVTNAAKKLIEEALTARSIVGNRDRSC